MTTLSPWVSIVAREVEFERGAPRELYHAVEQADYISIVALTEGGKIPIVRQYRPALEAFTWELPAGLVDPGEAPAEMSPRIARGDWPHHARDPSVGTHAPCTGRLNNRVHTFFIEAGERIVDFKPEPGLTVKLVSPAEIVRMIKTGLFVAQLHVGALLLAELNGFLTLPKRAPRRRKRSQGR